MSNVKFCMVILGILVFGLLLVGCDDGSTNGNSVAGKINITGLEAYNGKYIAGIGGMMDESFELFAGSTLNINAFTGVLVTNGSVTLNVWVLDENKVATFRGNGVGAFAVLVSPIPSIDFSDQDYILGLGGFVIINFVNGGGSGQLTQDDPWTR